ncbi:MAG: hypothetical protein U9M94_03985 [Patescibacteria group bacterium]|nr:hypothetical protein [Patescibacteria group bacterium]
MVKIQRINNRLPKNYGGKLLNSKRKKRNILSWKLLSGTIIFLTVLSGLCYIVTINDLAVKGIVLEELKKEATRQNNLTNDYELAIMEMESYDNINKRAKDMKMVKVDKIDYITINNEGVAKK